MADLFKSLSTVTFSIGMSLSFSTKISIHIECTNFVLAYKLAY